MEGMIERGSVAAPREKKKKRKMIGKVSLFSG